MLSKIKVFGHALDQVNKRPNTLVYGPDQISGPNRGTKRECYQLIVLPEVF